MEIVNTWKPVYLKMFPYFAGLFQADWWSAVMQQCPKKIYTKKIILMSLMFFLFFSGSVRVDTSVFTLMGLSFVNNVM